MACRAVKCSSSHSYCPSLHRSSLPLFCLSRFSLWLSHLSPSVTSLHVFFLPVLCTYLVPSVSFSLSVPSCLTVSSSPHPIIFCFSSQVLCQPLYLTRLLFSPSCSTFHPLSPSLSVGGVTALGRPPWGACLPWRLHFGRWETRLTPRRLHCEVRGTEGANRGQMLQEDLLCSHDAGWQLVVEALIWFSSLCWSEFSFLRGSHL